MGILDFFGNSKRKEIEEDEQLRNSLEFKKRYTEVDKLLNLITNKSSINKDNLENNKDLLGIRIGKYEITSIPNEDNIKDERNKHLKFFVKNTEKNTVETFDTFEKIYTNNIYFDKTEQKYIPKKDEMYTKELYQNVKEKYAINFATRLEDIKREYCIDDSIEIEDNINVKINVPKKSKEIENIKIENIKIQGKDKDKVQAEEKAQEKVQEKETNKVTFINEDREKRKELQQKAIAKYGSKIRNKEQWYKRYNELRNKFGMKEVSSTDIDKLKRKREKNGFSLESDLTNEEKSEINKIKIEILKTQELCAKNDMKFGDIKFSVSGFKKYEELDFKNTNLRDNINFKILGTDTKSGEVLVFNAEDFIKFGQDNYKDIMKSILDKGVKGALEVKDFINKFYKTEFELEKAYKEIGIKNTQHINSLLIAGDKTNFLNSTFKELESIREEIKDNPNISIEEKNEFIKDKSKEVSKIVLNHIDNEIRNENLSIGFYKIITKAIGKQRIENAVYNFANQLLNGNTKDVKEFVEDNIKVEENQKNRYNEKSKEEKNEKSDNKLNNYTSENLDKVLLKDFEM
jgi:hypothetical protein